MPKAAFVVLGTDGAVMKTHSTDVAGTGSLDVETLITAGYQPVREVVFNDGRVLLVLSKP